jgi:hypothetical protein
MTGAPWAKPEPWTPQQIATFRDLWVNTKLSIDAIGERIGNSRNSVASKRKSLGLTPRTFYGKGDRRKARKPAPAPASTAQRPKGAPAGNRNLAAWGAARKVAARSTPPPLPPAARLARPKSIAAAGLRDCRYIGARPELVTVDTPIFCGRRAREHSSYCEEHHALCWTRPTGRRAGLPPAAAGKPPM